MELAKRNDVLRTILCELEQEKNEYDGYDRVPVTSPLISGIQQRINKAIALVTKHFHDEEEKRAAGAAAKKNTLYHITRQECMGDILMYGLQPMVGKNSSICKEDLPVICLCEEKDIRTWQILTGGTVLIKLDRSKIGMEGTEEISYDKYSELRVYHGIPAEAILDVRPLRKVSPNCRAMGRLAEGYLQTMSLLCEDICTTEYRLMRPGLPETLRCDLADRCIRIKDDVMATHEILKKINFGTLTDSSAARIIRFHSNEMCGISLADTYLDPVFYGRAQFPDAGMRCWEHLANVDASISRELADAGKVLYQDIKQYVPYYARKLKHVGGFAPAKYA